jgi:aspartate/methionine/tyrosine aminotransferase
MKSTKAMTGWRLGFGLFPKELVEPARNLAINSWTCDFAGENHG